MKRLKKILLVSIGLISFILGAIGSVLPLLPTTPFLLLSAFCFIRSSEAFHRWLKTTRLYQRYVAEYLETRSISMRNKLNILLSVYIMVGISIYFTPLPLIRLMLVFMLVTQTIVLFFFIPTRPVEKEKE
ncbi:YbaN family protein [Pisciglobus halotolerans]|uniref:DUF454 domain-containing protein n=1 Tax=Pisciglobus halotolerans TaxID=745365 RepID=A0A1I3CDW4_9LACT|nr:YbaN family protein [Pisciglobus halotolerans]SFH72241.1 hypothetical protein SAMN04489868_11634 [Pisciglobus halotolerans]